MSFFFYIFLSLLLLFRGLLLIISFSSGRTYGGVSSAAECELLPDHLRSGCYWRFNWARDDLNDRNVEITQIACPTALKNISGCEPGY